MREDIDQIFLSHCAGVLSLYLSSQSNVFHIWNYITTFWIYLFRKSFNKNKKELRIQIGCILIMSTTQWFINNKIRIV
jgi:hypothetical protein